MSLATEPTDDLIEIEELVHRIGAGDLRSFEEFYDRFAGLIYATAFRVLGNESDAQEVAQEALFLIWERAPMYDAGKGKPLTWAITITRNKAIDRIRLHQRRHRLQDAVENEVPVDDLNHQRAPYEDLDHSEQGGIIREAVLKLNDDQREAIEMVYFGGLTQQEIANRLNEPLGTVKARIRRGLLRLRQILGPAL